MEALAKARQAMDVDSTVLITGETGTGKMCSRGPSTLAAGARTSPLFPCRAAPFPRTWWRASCSLPAAPSPGLTESRIGKMQVADGGSLFLDEIGEMPVEAQSKLLRVLQEGTFYAVGGNREIEVDVRFICATNRPFDRAIAEGLFRQDLYYRINVLPITMPPLRKRREDIPQLVAHFVAKHGRA